MFSVVYPNAAANEVEKIVGLISSFEHPPSPAVMECYMLRYRESAATAIEHIEELKDMAKENAQNSIFESAEAGSDTAGLDTASIAVGTDEEVCNVDDPPKIDTDLQSGAGSGTASIIVGMSDKCCTLEDFQKKEVDLKKITNFEDVSEESKAVLNESRRKSI